MLLRKIERKRLSKQAAKDGNYIAALKMTDDWFDPERAGYKDFLFVAGLCYKAGEYRKAYSLYKSIDPLYLNEKSRAKLKVIKNRLALEDYSKEVLYTDDSSHLVGWKHKARRNKKIIVTFTGSQREYDYSKMLRSKGFARDFFINRGYDVVVVIRKQYLYWQDIPDQCFFFSALESFVSEYEDIYFYGASGGGYAALFYAIPFENMGKNVSVIAISPRISIDECIGKREESIAVKMAHPTLDQLTSNIKAYVYYDPYNMPDRNFLEKRVRPCFNNLEIKGIPFMGHGAFYLSETGLIKQSLISIIEGGKIFNGSDRQLKKKSKIYHYHLAAYLFSQEKYTLGLVVASRCMNLHDKKTKFDKSHTKFLVHKFKSKGKLSEVQISRFFFHG